MHKLLAVHRQVRPKVLRFEQQQKWAVPVNEGTRQERTKVVTVPEPASLTSNTMWTTPLAVDGPVAGAGPAAMTTEAMAPPSSSSSSAVIAISRHSGCRSVTGPSHRQDWGRGLGRGI